MKVVFKYTSDKTGRPAVKETFLDSIPGRRFDRVVMEGRARQINRVVFEVENDDDQFVTVYLVG